MQIPQRARRERSYHTNRWTELEAGGADEIDGRGLTLMPGLIDAHVQFSDQAEAASPQALRLGVTTQLDTFSAGERLERLKKLRFEARADVEAVRTAGIGATVAGGHPTQMGGGVTFLTIAAPKDAKAFVDGRVAEGSDYIKIVDDGGSAWSARAAPTLDLPTMRALVERACAQQIRCRACDHRGGSASRRHRRRGRARAHVRRGDVVARFRPLRRRSRRVRDPHALGGPGVRVRAGPRQTILADPQLGPHIDARWRIDGQAEAGSRAEPEVRRRRRRAATTSSARVPIPRGPMRLPRDHVRRVPPWRVGNAGRAGITPTKPSPPRRP